MTTDSTSDFEFFILLAKLKSLSGAARALVRSVSPRLGDDRSLSGDIEAVADAIRDGSAIAAVEAEAGELQ